MEGRVQHQQEDGIECVDFLLPTRGIHKWDKHNLIMGSGEQMRVHLDKFKNIKQIYNLNVRQIKDLTNGVMKQIILLQPHKLCSTTDV